MKYNATTGDDGYTGLLGDQRHDKPTAYGEVDETQAALGMARVLYQAAGTSRWRNDASMARSG